MPRIPTLFSASIGFDSIGQLVSIEHDAAAASEVDNGAVEAR